MCSIWTAMSVEEMFSSVRSCFSKSCDNIHVSQFSLRFLFPLFSFSLFSCFTKTTAGHRALDGGQRGAQSGTFVSQTGLQVTRMILNIYCLLFIYYSLHIYYFYFEGYICFRDWTPHYSLDIYFLSFIICYFEWHICFSDWISSHRDDTPPLDGNGDKHIELGLIQQSTHLSQSAFQ